MPPPVSPVYQLACKIGYWSSILFALTGIGYAAGMVALLIAFPVPEWRGITDTVAGFDTSYVTYYSLCQTMAFISAPLFVVMICCAHEYTSPEKRILTRISICFGIMFALLSQV
ncbi:hypothetical protein ACFSCZ_06700 [Siminovitchia sediminis]|uniref:Uncharacterized protein n=1 Tax=Siminovitchia sediminis TaxID=1274353 RepID=A0ABW4KG14_9BACI